MNSSNSLAVQMRLPLDRFELDVAFRTTCRVTGIFGVSGSGKTTLLETIAGLRRRAYGRISLGENVWLDSERNIHVPPERRGIGYVPQESLLFPNHTVLGNLRAGYRRALSEGIDFDRTLRTVIRVLEIEPLLDRQVDLLSGGERQRVALGRALCSGPRLLLLDEPLASLDAGLRRRVLPFLHKVQSEFGLPMLIVSHNPVEVQALCEELIVLRDGKIIAQGEPRAVLTRPEIFPLAEHEGYENMLSGSVVESRNETSVVRLGSTADAPLLIAPRIIAPVGSTVQLSVPASEIMLATERPSGLSARNIVAATVSDIELIGDLRLVTATVAPTVPPIVVEVTADAIEELHISAGSPLFLVIKTSAMTVYEEGGEF
jgi:molybdate transport system ATP-binding protein